MSTAEIKMAAIYMFGLKRQLAKPEVAALLSTRAGMKPDAASTLADRWFTSEPYRLGVLSNGRPLWGEGWGAHGQSQQEKS